MTLQLGATIRVWLEHWKIYIKKMKCMIACACRGWGRVFPGLPKHYNIITTFTQRHHARPSATHSRTKYWFLDKSYCMASSVSSTLWTFSLDSRKEGLGVSFETELCTDWRRGCWREGSLYSFVLLRWRTGQLMTEHSPASLELPWTGWRRDDNHKSKSYIGTSKKGGEAASTHSLRWMLLPPPVQYVSELIDWLTCVLL